MNNSQRWVERRRAVLPRGLGQFVGELTAHRGSGARLTDADGREIIDFAGGIGVLNVGHCHPNVVRAIVEQAQKLLHVCIHVATHPTYLELCELLAELLPHGPQTKVMLTNSGSEAVENAIKIARQATGRPAVLCYTDSFHGRTHMAVSLTSKIGCKAGCGPFAPEVYRLPYPDHFRYGDGLSVEDFVERELDRLQDAFRTTVAADQLAAVILEPVQGDGGFVPAPHSYLQGLRRLCQKQGILLIADEIQSGFCRTGRWAAFEHAGIVPDISTYAKSMGSGLPIGAVIGGSEVMDAALPGTLGGTFSGNPVCCAAALATLRVMQEQDLNTRATVIGRQMSACLNELRQSTSLVADVRGLGAMMGIELCHQGDRRRPATQAVRAIIDDCLDQGLLVLPAGPHRNVIRLLTPLTINDQDLEQGLGILAAAVQKAAKSDNPG